MKRGEASNTINPGSPASYNTIIGSLGSAPTGYSVNGSIDNVRVYDRALDTSEIQKLYAMDAGKHGVAFVGDISPLK